MYLLSVNLWDRSFKRKRNLLLQLYYTNILIGIRFIYKCKALIISNEKCKNLFILVFFYGFHMSRAHCRYSQIFDVSIIISPLRDVIYYAKFFRRLPFFQPHTFSILRPQRRKRLRLDIREHSAMLNGKFLSAFVYKLYVIRVWGV